MTAPRATLRAAALGYASAGWLVFACRVGGKIPGTPNGLRDATNDPAIVNGMWRLEPHANIGLLLPEGYFVLDFDVPNDPHKTLAARQLEPRKRLRMMQDRFGEFASSALHGTPSGGYHGGFLRRPHGTPRLTTGPWPGSTGEHYGEIRGEGKAYIIAPPSLVDGRRYRALVPLEAPENLPVASQALLDYLNPPRPPAPRPTTPRGPTSNRYAEVAFDREAEAVATAHQGTRNYTLNRAAFNLGQLVGAGLLDASEVVTTLIAAATTCGLPESEAITTINSGLAAGRRNPRELTQ